MIKITVTEIPPGGKAKTYEKQLSKRAEIYLDGCRTYNPEEQDLAVWINEILENSA